MMECHSRRPRTRTALPPTALFRTARRSKSQCRCCCAPAAPVAMTAAAPQAESNAQSAAEPPNSRTACLRQHRSESAPSPLAASQDSSPRPSVGPPSPLARYAGDSPAAQGSFRCESHKRAAGRCNDERAPAPSTGSEKQSHRTIEARSSPIACTVEAIGTFPAPETARICPAQHVIVCSNQLRCVERKCSEAEPTRVQQVRPELLGDMKQHARTLGEDKLILLHPFLRNIRHRELKRRSVSTALRCAPCLLFMGRSTSQACECDCVSSPQQLHGQLRCKGPDAASRVTRQQNAHATSLSSKSDNPIPVGADEQFDLRYRRTPSSPQAENPCE